MDTGRRKRLAFYIVIGTLCCCACRQNRTPEGPRVPPGAVLVNITMVGFDPAVIEAKAGKPLKLAFFRPNAANCAREVVFPDLGIRKELPPGQTVVVDVMPPKSGTLGFECGMKMLKGQLIVR